MASYIKDLRTFHRGIAEQLRVKSYIYSKILSLRKCSKEKKKEKEEKKKKEKKKKKEEE